MAFKRIRQQSSQFVENKVDRSKIEKLKELGYKTTPIAKDPSILKTTRPTVKEVLPETRVGGYEDSFGNFYVVDEDNTVVRVEPEHKIFVTGGELVPPPEIFTPSPPSPPPPSDTPPETPPPPAGPPNFGSGEIFTRFDVDDIVPNQQEINTRALWSGNVGVLTTFYLNENQTDQQKRYYYEIYNSGSGLCGSEPQFAVAYGHVNGSGSADEGGQLEDTPTRAIYGQYRLLCLGGKTNKFIINGKSTDHIYVINVNRARMRDYLDEGNIEINLAHLSGSEFVAGGGDPNAYTGSAVTLAGNGAVLRLIDDSRINDPTITDVGEVYNIVSGNLETGVYNSSQPHVYGLLYKRLGVIVLDADALDASASFGTVTGSEVAGDNAYKLYLSISGAAQYTDASGDPLGFAGRSVEVVKSTHYFVRVKNQKYNFSNNPTFVTGSEGDLAHPSFIGDPTVYITTVGLYNERREMVAVAKLSRPLKKRFDTEALIKVRLIW